MKIYIDQEAVPAINQVCDRALKGSGLEVLSAVNQVLNKAQIIKEEPEESSVQEEPENESM